MIAGKVGRNRDAKVSSFVLKEIEKRLFIRIDNVV